MPIPRRVRPVLSFAIVLVSAAGCGGSEATPPTGNAPVATVAVTPTTASIPVQATTTLTAVARDASGTSLAGKSITWTSENTAIATVNAGVVTGVSPGTVGITATSEGRSGNAQVTVTASGGPSITITVGDGQQAEPGSLVPRKPIVTVRNAAGRPAAGVVVSFVVDSGGGSVQTATATTASDGTASSGDWQLGSNEGRNVLLVTAGIAPPARIVATAAVVTATITTQSLGTGGGTITVNRPSSTLHGTSVRFPNGALQSAATITLSLKSALQFSLPQDVVPATPIVTINANAAALTQPVLVRLPVPEQTGMIRVALTRSASGQIRVLPTISSDATSFTVALGDLGATTAATIGAAAHASVASAQQAQVEPIEVLATKFLEEMLAGDRDSGFRPGVDDWDFARQPIAAPSSAGASTVDPASAMMATALWYFRNRKGTDGKLWQRFQQAEGIPESNRRGLRWVGVAAPYFGGFYALSDVSETMKADVAANPRRAASLQYRMIKLAMRPFPASTAVPAPVLLFAGTSIDAPRAAIAFRAVDNVIELAIPDQPGVTFRAVFTDDGITPFTVATIGGGTFTVTAIGGAEGFNIVSASGLEAQWPTVVNGTIGTAEGWPATQLRGATADGNVIDLDPNDRVLLNPYTHWWRCATCANSGFVPTNIPNEDNRWLLFRRATRNANGSYSPLLPTMFTSASYSAEEIKPALESTQGFALYQPGAGSGFGMANGQSWIDWKTVRYRRLPTTIAPKNVEASRDTTVNFSATVDNVPANARFQWLLQAPLGETPVTTTVPTHARVLSEPGNAKMVLFILDNVTGLPIGTDTSLLAIDAPKKWQFLTLQQTQIVNTFPLNHQPAVPTWESARTFNELRDSLVARPAGATLTLYAGGQARPQGFKRSDDNLVRAGTQAHLPSMYLTYPRGADLLLEVVGSVGDATAPGLPANNYPLDFDNRLVQSTSSSFTYDGKAANWVRPMSVLIGNGCQGGPGIGAPSSLARSFIEIVATANGNSLAGTLIFVTQHAAIEIQAQPSVCWWQPMAEVRRTFSFTAVRAP